MILRTEAAAILKVTGAILAFQLLGASVLAAQNQDATALYPASPTGMVTDVAELIDAATEATIEARLARLRATTGAEVAVVTLPTLGNREPEEVALSIGRSWGVGDDAAIGDQRRNAGIVLLIVPRTADRAGEVRWEVGRGLEGVITDLQAGGLSDAMLPDLRRGDFGAAADLGTRIAADQIVRGLGLVDSTLTQEPRAGPGLKRGLPFVPIILFIILSIIANGRGGGRGGRGRRGGSDLLTAMILGNMLGGGRGGFGGGGGGGGGFGGVGGGGGFSGGAGGRSF